MSRNATDTPRSRCLNCGFESASGGDDWGAVQVTNLGTLAQCPECNSTNILTGL
jgi:hypothetical protein